MILIYQELETNPTNVKSVLKRLYSYSLHPNPFKRLGAALAFNNIYTVFRYTTVAYQICIGFVTKQT